jgi:hypothetical protein
MALETLDFHGDEILPGDDHLSITKPEPHYLDTCWGQASPTDWRVASIGQDLERAAHGLNGVLRVLEIDNRNNESAKNNAGVHYTPINANLRGELYLAAEALSNSVLSNVDRLRDAMTKSAPKA